MTTLEDCFSRMQAEHERGRTPVPDLSNLDVYYDIGAELDLEAMETLDGDTYRALYREKLADSDALSPVANDSPALGARRATPTRQSAYPSETLASRAAPL